MRREIRIEIKCDTDEEFGQQVAELADALVQINVAQLATDHTLPCCLSCGGVRYQPPQPCERRAGRPLAPSAVSDCQRIRDARGIYGAHVGTCLDLACERAARLRLAGDDQAIVAIEFEDGASNRYHAFVETAHGRQDPAAELQQHGVGCLCDDGESDGEDEA